MYVYIREVSSTPGKLLSARYSKQVGVGGVNGDGVQSHTILLVVFHYKNPKAGRHGSLKAVVLVVVDTEPMYSHIYRGSSHM